MDKLMGQHLEKPVDNLETGCRFMQAEYIWLDGAQPTQQLRSKTKILPLGNNGMAELNSFPDWGFDGSSTYQAIGKDSDLTLQPVRFVRDPIRGGENFLVMCEVFDADGKPHASNTRAVLRSVLDAGGAKLESWFGFEQEYTLFQGRSPFNWPEEGYPAPQGPFYCSVGADVNWGRPLIEDHTLACLKAGLMIYGTNAEVMPSQWEFQIGYRGQAGESADPLTVADHLWLARWLLCRLGENYGIAVSFAPKPVKGDWNGAGMHSNFSTKEIRTPGKGLTAIETAIAALGKTHDEHIALYGHGIEERLTGLHETCAIDQFRSAVADRGASIRIPRHVSKKGVGYLEDRRPAANADPYVVCSRMIKTICGLN